VALEEAFLVAVEAFLAATAAEAIEVEGAAAAVGEGIGAVAAGVGVGAITGMWLRTTRSSATQPPRPLLLPGAHLRQARSQARRR
jgi:hypothetical protein